MENERNLLRDKLTRLEKQELTLIEDRWTDLSAICDRGQQTGLHGFPWLSMAFQQCKTGQQATLSTPGPKKLAEAVE